jgi:Zn-dependent peptidase ImmA (M78 family)
MNEPVYKIRDRVYGWRVNQEGVPILSADEIEDIAEDFLERFDAGVLENARKTHLGKIVQTLTRDYGLTFNYSINIGIDADGRKILGKFTPAYRTIYIDPSLIYQKARWKFTLAHEIGHFVFHSKIEVSENLGEGFSRSDNYRTLSLHSVDGKSSKNWVEWQANRFAGAILVPRFTLKEKLIHFQSLMGITTRLGEIYLDHQPINRRDYQKLIFYLHHTYGVSSAVIKVRLRNLEMIVGKSNAQKASSLLSDVFAEIYANVHQK